MQELNPAQRQAVSHFEGPMLVLAGPGSGKTRTITERIHYLIHERGVNPSKILVITFTRAAATEMKQRYQNLYSTGTSGVRFGTFHAIFFMILKHAYHYTADNIVRDEVRHDLLKQFLRETDLEVQDENEFISDLESEISRVKGDRIDLKNYFSPLCSNDVFQEIYRKYQNALERKRLLDFDDMLVYCLELLEQRKDILQAWQQQFQYILIDEFQDICLVQYEIIKLLAEPERNLFIVGDDDQSIYGFRGARPDIMRQFLKDYPEAKQTLLDINYRCDREIVHAAGKLIACNKNRLPKNIRTKDEADACERNSIGETISLTEYPNISTQNETIREQILAYRKAGIPYGEMAVLFRTNTQARALSGKLMEYNIPFYMKERIPNLYDHWIVQDVLTYIRVALGNRERAQVMRIINRPKRYVHRNAFTEPYADFEELKKFYEDKDWMVDRIEELQYNLSMIAKMRPYAAINFIRRGVGYEDYLEEYAEYRGMRLMDLLETLDELMEEAKEQDSFEEWFDYMQRYREELEAQSEKKKDLRFEDAVTLMTMHGSKGLEYECVFIPDANEGVTPHNKSVLAADMEEERRMFYVAMTRAKKHLHISYVKERFHKMADVSRFVEEITAASSPCDTQPGFD